MRRAALVGVFLMVAVVCVPAGTIIVTGHDPDFHGSPLSTENPQGARDLLSAFVNGVYRGSGEYLFLRPQAPAILPCAPAVPCLFESYYGVQAAIPTVHAISASDFLNDPNNGMQPYNLSQVGALIIPSDFGGNMDFPVLSALIQRSNDLTSYLIGGGGMVVLSEQGQNLSYLQGHSGLFYSFLPFPVSWHASDRDETNFQITPLGNSLGVQSSYLTGPHFSHVYFDQVPGMSPIDVDGTDVISFQREVVPEPATLLLLGSGLGLLGLRRRGRRIL